MSTFKCEVLSISIEAHPDPEALAIELACIGGYRSVVRKGAFKSGDLVAYLPEAAVLPDSLLEELGLTGKLKGAARNRIGAIKLRGQLSQGICYPAKPEWVLGQDVQEELGIKKWEPEVPVALQGEMNVCPGVRLRFDLENIKKFPNLIAAGEEVIITEKLHGTCGVFGDIGIKNRHPEMFEGRYWVSTKNAANGALGPTGMFFKDNERNQKNLYVRMFRDNKIAESLAAIRENLELEENEDLWILGEIFGKGIQDLQYGLQKPELRIFAMKIGEKWLSLEVVNALCSLCGLTLVPLLYQGPFCQEILESHTNGRESASGTAAHTREGVVVTLVKEGYSSDIEHGRIALKSISADYLLRKNGTEFT